MTQEQELRSQWVTMARLCRDALDRRLTELAHAYADAALRLAAERLVLIDSRKDMA